MIGAGGQAGQGDAANLLKPALARGELRTIAATTWAEYKKYFEKDAALARRFQVVKVEEPDEVGRRRDDARPGRHAWSSITASASSTKRSSTPCGCRTATFPGRQLPDKSVSLLDTACARVAIGHAATPPAVEDCRRRIEQLGVAIGDPRPRGPRRRPTIAEAARRADRGEDQDRSGTGGAGNAVEGRNWSLVEKIRAIRRQLEAGRIKG